MKPNKFTITGRVTDSQTHQGIPGLRIEAWDKDLIFHDLVGTDVTEDQGRFRFSFTSDYFSGIFLDRRPDLFFKIFHNGRLVRSTEDSVLWNVEQGNAGITIEIDLAAAEEPKEFVVYGTVRDETGVLQEGLTVKATDHDLDSEELLGETMTDKTGYYEVRYTPDQFARAEKTTADLEVTVFNEQGKTLAHSGIHFNATPKEEINLILGSGVIRPPSEYEQLVAELTPLLNGLSFAELEESDEHKNISFLSGETGQDPQRIQALASAHRFENQARNLIGEETGDSFSLTAPVFFGLFREGMPTDFQALIQQSFHLLRKALEKALENNIIPKDLAVSLDAVFEDFALLVDKIDRL